MRRTRARVRERCDTRAGERVTGRDDVWLIGMAAEAMEHRRSANRICLRQMQHAVELGVLDADSDTLRWHRSLPRRGGRFRRKLRKREQLEDLPPVFDPRARADELENLLAAFHPSDEARTDELIPEDKEPLVVAWLV